MAETDRERSPVPERFAPGDRVRTSHIDPPHHTRLPGYARGAAGTVIEQQGAFPLPDDRARGVDSAPRPVYAVSFAARELFGFGGHTVTLALWQDYLQPAGADADHGGPGVQEVEDD